MIEKPLRQLRPDMVDAGDIGHQGETFRQRP
jgi:hypothetical protein